jgi:NADH dehydrogenase
MAGQQRGFAVSRPGPPRLMRRMTEAKHRVVILGGGFAGVHTARRLTRLLGRRTDVHVELLSEENYFVFQPLLPEVAAGGVSPSHVVNPIRDIVPKAQFRWCKVNAVDVERRVVQVAQGEGRELVEVPYDHLVFALGKVSDTSSMPGVAEHGLAMKDLGDAFRLRSHVFRCLELADIEDDPEEKRALLTFVIAGGGFSGVETTGELSEMLHKTVGSFGNVEMGEVRIILIHSRDTVLPEMAPNLGTAAGAVLRRRGVEMILNARIRAATRHGVYLSNGQFLQTRTLVGTVGNAANPVARQMLAEGGFAEGKVEGRGVGVFETNVNLACTGKPGYWAVGDNAGIPDARHPGKLCPPTGQFAIREARTCARNILASIDGKPLTPFDFGALGMFASLGRRSAVADILGMKFTGFPAWVAWRGYYLSQLPGFIRKLRVAIDWGLDLFFPRDIAQIETAKPGRLRMDHYEPGEIIIAKHEIGRELFIVKAGEVEVFQPAENGTTEVCVAVLTRGDVFGEKPLLEDVPRNASVRAKTAVDALVLSREDFAVMMEQMPLIDSYFNHLMHERYPQEFADGEDLSGKMAKTIAQPGRRRRD